MKNQLKAAAMIAGAIVVMIAYKLIWDRLEAKKKGNPKKGSYPNWG